MNGVRLRRKIYVPKHILDTKLVSHTPRSCDKVNHCTLQAMFCALNIIWLQKNVVKTSRKIHVQLHTFKSQGVYLSET